MEQLTTLDRAIRLQGIELFSDLETEVLALLAGIAQQVELGEGEKLFEEGESLRTLYVVLDGQIQLGRGGAAVFTVDPGETVGNWALFEDQPSVVSAHAVRPTSLLKIERDDFYDLLADHAEMTQGMFQSLFKRVRSVLTAGLGEDANSGSREQSPDGDQRTAEP